MRLDPGAHLKGQVWGGSGANGRDLAPAPGCEDRSRCKPWLCAMSGHRRRSSSPKAFCRYRHWRPRLGNIAHAFRVADALPSLRRVGLNAIRATLTSCCSPDCSPLKAVPVYGLAAARDWRSGELPLLPVCASGPGERGTMSPRPRSPGPRSPARPCGRNSKIDTAPSPP